MGDSGRGITHGVAGAMLNTALILGEDHPWKELYAPGRFPLKAAKNLQPARPRRVPVKLHFKYRDPPLLVMQNQPRSAPP
jgi:hypothetical protein